MISAVGTVAFLVAVAVGGAIFVGIVASALGIGSYWPPGDRNRNYYVHWIGSQVFNLAIIAAYVADPSGWVAPLELLVPGLALTVAGFGVAAAAAFDLGIEETSGLEGELRTDGWYRYSRNPQYVGYFVACLGCILLANAPQVTVLMAIYLGWWVALPFAEEPWLREQYGEEYEQYADRVPRFVGIGTVHALVGRRDAASE